ncbi:unnamed protein product [Adineta ricciae]|uniref:Uncharacterized protein n=1 Tax=Adineta ricciae TaxID=249248 RepID=A0A814ZUW5_ADIRI|nr:unnamed protein product [Adineta ricciae]CAF1248708.1 unnamed protein product [Adineta ricciae]
MATAIDKTQCCLCNKYKITYPCPGCSNQFCFEDLVRHRQKLNEEFNTIINDYDQFRESIHQLKQNPHDSPFVKGINQWETDSIELIQRTAQRCRQTVIEEIQVFIDDIEEKFKKLIGEIKYLQEENEVNENNLKDLKEKLIKITKEFYDPSTISLSKKKKNIHKQSHLSKWKQNGLTIVGGYGNGKRINQLSDPGGMFIDKDNNIFIVDTGNQRIMKWTSDEKYVEVVAGNNRVIQWWNQNQQQILIQNISCYGLTTDKYGFLYVSDREKNEVRRWIIREKGNGKLVAGGNGKGFKFNQLNSPTFIFVDDEQSVYISDWGNHRVMKWRKDAKEGTVVAGGNGGGSFLSQLISPQGLIVDQFGQIYAADCYNHRIMRWCEGKQEGEIVVGRNRQGEESNELYSPTGLSFDAEGNLYVVDWRNHRVQRFDLAYD